MRNRRSGWGGSRASAVLLLWMCVGGCPENDASACGDFAGGTWVPRYVLLDGDCGPIDEPFRFMLVGPHALNALLERRADRTIDSEAVVKGCQARFSQFVVDGQNRLVEQTEIEGRAEPGGSPVHGTATLTRFSPAGDMVCEGRYSVSLAREPD